MKVGKLALKIVVGLVIVLVVLLIVAWLMIDKLVETGIEKGGTYAVKVDTTVDNVDLSLLGGTLEINGLKIANPEGFDTPHMMHSSVFKLGVDTGTLLSDTIKLTEFTIDGLEIYIDQPIGIGKKSNIGVIMDNLKQLGGSGGEPDEDEPEEDDDAGGGKKVLIDTITVKNVIAYVKLGNGEPIKVEVPEIILNDVTSEGEGVNVPILVARILPPILIAVIKQGGGILPPGALDDVGASVTGTAAALGGKTAELLNQTVEGLGEGLGGLGEGLGKSGEGIKEGLEGLLKKKEDDGTGEKKPGLGEGLKDLLGGNKKE